MSIDRLFFSFFKPKLDEKQKKEISDYEKKRYIEKKKKEIDERYK